MKSYCFINILTLSSIGSDKPLAANGASTVFPHEKRTPFLGGHVLLEFGVMFIEHCVIHYFICLVLATAETIHRSFSNNSKSNRSDSRQRRQQVAITRGGSNTRWGIGAAGTSDSQLFQFVATATGFAFLRLFTRTFEPGTAIL
jgi:hypothetical protein